MLLFVQFLTLFKVHLDAQAFLLQLEFRQEFFWEVMDPILRGQTPLNGGASLTSRCLRTDTTVEKFQRSSDLDLYLCPPRLEVVRFVETKQEWVLDEG